MTELRVRPEAERDAHSAAVWYEAEQRGLGDEFLSAVGAAFRRIEESPKHFPVVHGHVRRAILQRFPYGVFFALDEQTAMVMAVMHLHRDPSSWNRRAWA